MNPRWKTKEFFRMWPRALFDMKAGKPILERHFGKVAGVYVLYRDDVPHYIGKTGTTLLKTPSQPRIETEYPSLQLLELLFCVQHR